MTDKFMGFPYPIVQGPQGYFARQSGTEQIKADILILLLTNPGERVYEVDFGTPLNDLFFDPNDETIAAKARQMIIDSLNKYEPRVKIEQITVTTGLDSNTRSPLDDGSEGGGVLTIKIDFIDPDNIPEVQSLVLEVPISAG